MPGAGGFDPHKMAADAAKQAQAAVRANAAAERSVEARLSGLDEVMANLERWYQGTLKRAAVAMEEIAALLESYAKANHEWKDDTGATTTSISGFISEATPLVITATLSAGMSYDVFLELARDGKWAWLWPAVEANLDNIRAKLAGIQTS